MASNSDFFSSSESIPDRPEPVEDDWTYDDYSEKCSNCGQIYAYHTPNQALFCAKLIIENSISVGDASV